MNVISARRIPVNGSIWMCEYFDNLVSRAAEQPVNTGITRLWIQFLVVFGFIFSVVFLDFPLQLFFSNSQMIGWEEHLQ